MIVSHGAEDLLRRCLDSLRKNPPTSGEMKVAVVDSGSPDGTPDMVEREFPEFDLLRRENIGFSAANNIVLRSTAAEFCLLLNPDTEVHPGALDAAIGRLEGDPAIGMVGVRLLTESGELDHACKRSFPTPLGALAHFTGLGRRAGMPNGLRQYRATELGEFESGYVDAVNGAFMMVRLDALEKTGPLDEGYWLYMEDLDWCRRFWRAAWSVFYEPDGTVLHVKGGSSGRRRGFRQEVAFHRGMGRFYRRFDSAAHSPALNAVIYCGIAAKLATSLLITMVQGRQSTSS